jgi:hypothetical protein
MKQINDQTLYYPINCTFKRYFIVPTQTHDTFLDYESYIHASVKTDINDAIYLRLVWMDSPQCYGCRLGLKLTDAHGNNYIAYRAIRMSPNSFIITNLPEKLNTSNARPRTRLALSRRNSTSELSANYLLIKFQKIDLRFEFLGSDYL